MCYFDANWTSSGENSIQGIRWITANATLNGKKSSDTSRYIYLGDIYVIDKNVQNNLDNCLSYNDKKIQIEQQFSDITWRNDFLLFGLQEVSRDKIYPHLDGEIRKRSHFDTAPHVSSGRYNPKLRI